MCLIYIFIYIFVCVCVYIYLYIITSGELRTHMRQTRHRDKCEFRPGNIIIILIIYYCDPIGKFGKHRVTHILWPQHVNMFKTAQRMCFKSTNILYWGWNRNFLLLRPNGWHFESHFSKTQTRPNSYYVYYIGKYSTPNCYNIVLISWLSRRVTLLPPINIYNIRAQWFINVHKNKTIHSRWWVHAL